MIRTITSQSSFYSSFRRGFRNAATTQQRRSFAPPPRRPTATSASQHHRVLKRRPLQQQDALHHQDKRVKSSSSIVENFLRQHEATSQTAATQEFEISRLAKKTGVRLTEPEMQLLRRQLGCKGDGLASFQEFQRLGKEAKEKQWARELMLNAVEQPSTVWDKFGSKLVFSLDFLGKGLFAVVGAQAAGDAGMNIVGATLIGCVAAMGGGTLNNLLYGHSTLDTQTGVRWVRNPSILFSAVICSAITFFVWPVYCREEAKRELRKVFGTKLQPDGSADQEAFVHACETNEEFRELIAKGLGKAGMKAINDPERLFQLADEDESGYLELDEMQQMVGKRFSGSDVIYGLDTIAFASLSVFGVHQATTRGLNPFVACTSGVTICFGGIMRDVLCGKDIAVGGQSYAFATWMGSSVYVALRELGIRGVPIPLIARICMSFMTTVGIRAYEYYQGEPLLRPMHYQEEHKRFFDPDEEEDDNEDKFQPITKLVRHVTKIQPISSSQSPSR